MKIISKSGTLIISTITTTLIVMSSQISLVKASLLNVKHIHQISKDVFRVKCLNNKLETATSEEILSNSICKSRKNQSNINSSLNEKVICKGNDFRDDFYVNRISDGKHISNRLSARECLQSINR